MRKYRVLTAALCAVILMCGFAVPAYAGGGEDYGEYTGGYEEPAATEPTPIIEPGTGFTQNGNAVVRDLLYDKHTNKQFIAVETKDGNTFYVVIDYDKPVDEDADLYETYFLNLVDNADLTALLEDGNAAPAACSCADKCAAGAVNTACPVCSTNMSECMGAEPTPEPDDTPTPDSDAEPVEGDKESGGAGGLILAVIAVLAVGGAGYYFKVYRPKHLAADDGDEDEGGGAEDIDPWEDDGPPWDEDEGSEAGEVEDEE